MILARYNSNGSLDPTFSNDALTYCDCPVTDVSDLALQPNSRIVVAGTPFPISENGTFENGDIVLTRYYNNGSLDPTVGTNGTVYTDINQDSNDVANALIIQPDSKLVVA